MTVGVNRYRKKFLKQPTNGQVEERRLGLERYLQQVSQDPRVCRGVTFNGFLLGSQQETRGGDSSSGAVGEVDLDVCLMNGQKVGVRGPSVMQTDEVLEASRVQGMSML